MFIHNILSVDNSYPLATTTFEKEWYDINLFIQELESFDLSIVKYIEYINTLFISSKTTLLEDRSWKKKYLPINQNDSIIRFSKRDVTFVVASSYNSPMNLLGYIFDSGYLGRPRLLIIAVIGPLTQYVIENEHLVKALHRNTGLIIMDIGIGGGKFKPTKYYSIYRKKKNELNNKIARVIEFPPELVVAGSGLMMYFGNYIKNNYADQEVKVMIEQDDLKVRLIIEKADGNLDVIERALEEYGLIISGEEKPEKFISDPLQVLELKSELKIAATRLELKNDIITLQNNHISDLKQLLRENFSKSDTIKIDVRNTNVITVNQKIDLAIKPVLELKNKIPKDNEAYKKIKKLEKALERIKQEPDKEKVKKSSALKKLKNFISKGKDVNSSIGEAIKLYDAGKKTFEKLELSYEEILNWLM